MAAITRDDKGMDAVYTREQLADGGPYVTMSVNEKNEVEFILPDMGKSKGKKEMEKIEEAIGVPGFCNLSDTEKRDKLVEFMKSKGILDLSIPFTDRLAEAFDRPIIMADTMTLMKHEAYIDRMRLNENGTVKNGICMCDEADCEFLDARPYEVLNDEYSEETDKKRFEVRKAADRLVTQARKARGENGSLTREDLEKISQASKIPIDFLLDANDVRENFTREGEEYVIGEGGHVQTLNLSKRVLEADTQGHEQAIYAMRANDGQSIDDRPREREVMEVKYPYQVIGRYPVHSLISGTMEDRGLGTYKKDSPGLYERYSEARDNLFKKMGFLTPATMEGVVDYRTVGPLVREDKHMIMAPIDDRDFDKETDADGKLLADENFSLGGKTWKEFINSDRSGLEAKWVERVQHEVERRKAEDKPVLVSVLDDDMGKKLGSPTVYTDAHKPDPSMIKGGKLQLVPGQEYYMDDAYGRGYNSDFLNKDGHVVITSLPNNSRNLEQFLYRVARGDNAGSSSMIVSPTDPKLTEFLQRIDDTVQANGGRITEDQEKQFESAFSDQPELWEKIKSGEVSLSDAYFTSAMQSKIPMDRMVFDIYPEETIKFMEKMTGQIAFTKDIASHIADLMKMSYVDRSVDPPIDYGEYYGQALKKSEAKHIRTYDGSAASVEGDKIQQEASATVFLAAAQAKGVVMSEEMFMKLMPPAGSPERKLAFQSRYQELTQRAQQIIQEKSAREVKETDALEKKVESQESGRDPIEDAIDDYDIDADDVLDAAKDVKDMEQLLSSDRDDKTESMSEER